MDSFPSSSVRPNHQSPSAGIEDNSNQNGSRRSVTLKKPTTSNSAGNNSSPSKKSTKIHGGGSTDWRLNLQGMIPKWEYLLENKLFTDVTFFVGHTREVVQCHSLVLKMQSKHFEHMLSSDKNEYEVPFCSAAVFHKMLKYLYTDKLEFTADDAMDALLLARQFHLTTLQARCGRIVLEGINVGNAAVLLKKAEEMGDKQLSIKVQEYILQHAAQVVLTPGFKDISLTSLQKLLQANRALWKMSEVKILEAVKMWASTECARQGLENTGPNQYTVAKAALDHVHFTTFTPMQFTSQVVKPKLLPNDLMLEIQSELIEMEESTRSEYTPNHEHIVEDGYVDSRPANNDRPATASSLGGRTTSLETLQVTDDVDQVQYDQVYTLSRYSTLSSKDWRSDNEDGTYKISFNVSKTVTLVGLVLYGHGNGTTTLTDVYIKFASYDEEVTHLEFDTKSELPEEGGEFKVKLPRPLTMNKLEWYTVIIAVSGRVYPLGIGGKRTYTVETSYGESVGFYFKNSKGVSGATHVRGQLPKILFSVPPSLT